MHGTSRIPPSVLALVLGMVAPTPRQTGGHTRRLDHHED
jgi:hypothetical protein